MEHRSQPAGLWALAVVVGCTAFFWGAALSATSGAKALGAEPRPTAPGPAKPQHADGPGGRVLSDLLASARRAELDEHVIARRVSALGSTAIPAILDVLDAGEFHERLGKNGRVVHPLDGERRSGLLLALGALPWEPVKRRALTRLGPEASIAERSTALSVFGAAAPRGELQVFAQALTGVASAKRRSLHGALRASLAAALGREPSHLLEIDELFAGVPPAFASVVIDAVRDGDDAGALSGLTTLLGRLPEADTLIMLEIADLSKTVPRPVADSTLAPVREYLSSGAPSARVEAAKALGRLDDVRAIPELIRALDAQHAPLRQASRSALERLSAERFGRDAGAWKQWHGDALRWLEGEAPKLKGDLVSGDSARANRALLQLARFRVFRHALVPAVADLVDSGAGASGDDVVELACAVLGHFATSSSIPPLLRALGSGPESTRKAALEALVRATGVDHGERVEDWEARGWTTR